MATTYELIASQVLSSPTAIVTFSSIPDTYDDLILFLSLKTMSTSGDGIYTAGLVFKDSLGSSFSTPTIRGLRSNGSAASSYTSTTTYVAGTIPGGFNTANTFSNTEVYIPNYTSSAAKSASLSNVIESNDNSYARIVVGAISWPTTSVVSEIEINVPFTTYVANSSFYLYGVTHA